MSSQPAGITLGWKFDGIIRIKITRGRIRMNDAASIDGEIARSERNVLCLV